MRLIMRTLVYLACCGLVWGQHANLFQPTPHVVWMDGMIIVNLSISPGGSVLAFEEQVRDSAELTRVYMVTNTGSGPRLIWDSDEIEHIQALDNGILFHPRDTNIVYHVDTNLHQTTLLAAGFRTNLGDITSIEHIMVDDTDQTKIYFVGTIGNTRGFYRLVDSRTTELVVGTETVGYPNHFPSPHVSDSRLLSIGKFGDSIYIMQTNVGTGVSEKLFRARQKTGDRYYWHTPLTPWISGNLLSITTVDDLFPPQPGRYNYRTDLFRVTRGTFLPADIYGKGESLTKVMSTRRDSYGFQMTKSANWGTTAATLHDDEGSHAILEDGSTLISTGNRLFGDTLTRVELFSSSKIGLVGIVQKRNPDNTYPFGFYFVRTAPVPPPIEEDETDPPVFSAETITNAASFVPGPIAPRTWTSIFGENLISEKYAWRLHVDNVEVPLGRISLETSSQINFLTPDVLGPEAEIAIVHFDADGFEDVRTEVTVTVAQHAPGLFQMIDENGEYQVIVTNNSPFFVVTKERPVAQTAPGAINLWGTGFNPDVSIEVALENQSAEILWIGEVMPGLTQVNVLLPPNLSGTVLGEARIGGTIFPLRFYVEEVE